MARLSRSLAAALLVVRLFDELGAILVPAAFESMRVEFDLGYGQASAALVAVAPGSIVGGLFSALADYRSRRVIAAGARPGMPSPCSPSPPRRRTRSSSPARS